MAATVTPEAFKAARKRAGLTQKEAAEACGVHEVTYQSWELGKVKRLRAIYLERIRTAAIANKKRA